MLLTIPIAAETSETSGPIIIGFFSAETLDLFKNRHAERATSAVLFLLFAAKKVSGFIFNSITSVNFTDFHERTFNGVKTIFVLIVVDAAVAICVSISAIPNDGRLVPAAARKPT